MKIQLAVQVLRIDSIAGGSLSIGHTQLIVRKKQPRRRVRKVTGR
ncbi:hypothetical protein [Fodinisporobacter ferrooxydans]